jgi:YYY domain-containing protein
MKLSTSPMTSPRIHSPGSVRTLGRTYGVFALTAILFLISVALGPFFPTLFWFLAIELCGLLAFPWVAEALPHFPDRGYGISKITGLIVLGYVTWMLIALKVTPFTQTTVGFTLLALLGIAHWGTRRQHAGWKFLIRPVLSHVLVTEIIFLAIAGIFLWYHARPPATTGERPMDLTFLNYLMRATTLPPTNPWAAGLPLRYYYWGYYLIAQLLKLSGLSGGYGYNVALSTLPALLGAGAYSLGVWMRRRAWFGVLTAGVIVLGANLAPLFLLLVRKSHLDFMFVWDSSRILKDAIATEFPLWSFLFSDLHAHVIALPGKVALLALGTALMSTKALSRNADYRVDGLYGLLWGSFLATNTWDYFAFAVFTGVLFLFGKSGDQNPRTYWTARAQRFARIAIISVMAFTPFIQQTLNGASSPVDFVTTSQNTWGQFALVLGHFYLPLLALFALVSSRTPRPATMRGLLLGYSAAALAACAWNRSGPFLSWGIILSAVLLTYWSTKSESRLSNHRLRFAAGLAWTTGALTVLIECGYLCDRGNTLFKIFCDLWIFAGVAALGTLRPWGAFGKRPKAAEWRWPLLVTYGLGLASVVGGLTLLYIENPFGAQARAHRNLDLGRRLADVSPDEYALATWINSHVTGTPTLVTAEGPAYSAAARLTTVTGLPTLLGWPGHIELWGVTRQEIQQRSQDLGRIYQTENLEEARRLLARYHAGYLLVGELEAAAYGTSGLRKFETGSPHFVPVFQQNDTRLYQVR